MKKAKREKKEKISPMERMGELLEMPAGGMLNIPYFEMNGNRELLIDNCSGIIEYKEEMIRLCAGKFLVNVSGRGLYLKSMNEKSLLICGVILSIQILS